MNARLIFALIALCLAGLADAQQLAATASLEKRSDNWAYTFLVTNESPVERIASARIELVGDTHFDQANPQQGEAVIPDVGANNDAIHSKILTVTPTAPLAQGQRLEVRGDIDWQEPSAVRVTMTFASGEIRIIDLALEGLLWSASLNENAPPTVVIDGEADVALSWTAPTNRVDGTAIEPGELRGYGLYWGPQSRAGRCQAAPETILDACYDNALDLPDGAQTSHQVTLTITRDTSMYFAVAAYSEDSDGVTLLSDFSNEIERRFVVEVTEPGIEPPEPPTSIEVTIDVSCSTNVPGVTCTIRTE